MTDLATLRIAVDSTDANKAAASMERMGDAAERAERSASKMGKVLAGIGVAAGVTMLARQMYDTNVEFERLATSLVTVTKSQERANQVFRDLSQFAAKTPFQLREVTQAYILMRARGLDPTMDTIQSLGNLSSAMSRPLLDTVNAVGSLAAGEIEPIKQLGFSAMVIGDKVRISSDGVSKVVGRSAYEISKAVAQISEIKFSGGMERQINTLGGAMSNLKDQVDITFYRMGQSGMNSQLVHAIQATTAAIDEATPRLAHFAETAVSGTVNTIKFLTDHKNAILAVGAAYASVKIGQGVAGVASEFRSPRTGDDAGLGSRLRGAYDGFSGLFAPEIRQRVDALTGEITKYSAKATAGTVASRAFGASITALGGPIGATVTLLTAAAVLGPMAWEASKSSAQKASEEADKYLVRLREEVQLLDRKKQLQVEGRSNEANMDDEAIKALQAKERYAGELQVKLAEATRMRQEAEQNAGKFSGSYESALRIETAVRGNLNKVLAEYNEIARGSIRIKEENARKDAEARAMAQRESREAAEKSKRELEEQKKAQEVAKLAEEHKAFVKKLREENRIGAAEIASGASLNKEDEEVIKIREDAKKFRLAGAELEEAKKRAAQIYEKSAMEHSRKVDAEQRDDNAKALAEQSRRKFDALYSTFEDATRARSELAAYNEEVARLGKLAKLGAISQEEFGKALRDAPARFIEAARAASSLNDRYDADVLFAREKANLDQAKPYLQVGVYEKALRDLRLEQLRMKADSGNTWAIIGFTITQQADRASDAMVRWMNNTDGLGRTWTTLGKTLRSVIADMLMQMQRAIIQQQLMQPLLNWAGAGIGNWANGFSWGGDIKPGGTFSGGYGALMGLDLGAASGGFRDGSKPYLVGEQGPEIFMPGGPGTIIPNRALGGQTVITSQVIVNVDSNGNATSQVSSQGAERFASDLRENLEPMVLTVIHKHLRPGGALNPVN